MADQSFCRDRAHSASLEGPARSGNDMTASEGSAGRKARSAIAVHRSGRAAQRTVSKLAARQVS